MNMIDQIVAKAIPMAMDARYQIRALDRPEMASQLLFVVHPDTESEMKEEMRRDNPIVYWFAEHGEPEPKPSFIYGIKLTTSADIPAGEIELRSIVGRSWE